MAILRLTQHTIGEGKYLITARLEREGYAPFGGSAQVAFGLTGQDREELRWYLEDYLEHPFDPAPEIAARVEGRMEEIGAGLFGAIFGADERMGKVWGEAQGLLSETRVEIHTEVAEATAIPWELLYAPQLDDYVALQAAAFVRSYEEGKQPPRLPPPPLSPPNTPHASVRWGGGSTAQPIRILLVICRPKGDKDVPFRSVASRLVKGLRAEASQQVQLDVLRPPTFEQLGKVLRAAQRAGKPYHILHFDGHGTYLELPDQQQQAEARADLLDGVSSDFFKARRTGKHGYLLFENPNEKENMQLVDGRSLGQLLVKSHVPVLVLNACRSAHAQAPDEEPKTPPASEERESGRVGEGESGRGGEGESGRGGEGESGSRGNPSRLPKEGEEVKSKPKKGWLSRVGGFLRRWVPGSGGEPQKMGDEVPSTLTFSSSEQLLSGGEPPRAVFSGQQVFGQGDGRAERAYGSLAQEVMEQGVAGVVAMRYN
ncbi:MAG: CHAT domain-containing protein, partial [Ardenticatenaceae bacterium]